MVNFVLRWIVFKWLLPILNRPNHSNRKNQFFQCAI